MASPYKQIGQNLLDPEDWTHYETEPTDVEHYHFHTWALNFSIKTLEYNPNYEIEIWQSYDTEIFGECGIKVRNQYNLKSIIFPSTKVLNQYISFDMIRELRKRIKSGEKIIVHVQSIHKLFVYLIALECKNIPLVCSQRSTAPPPFKMIEYKWRSPSLIDKFFASFLEVLEIVLSNRIDHVFATSIGEYNYIKQHHPDKVTLVRGGGWFPEAAPSEDKYELRKKLGLPIKKKLMIWVGRLNSGRGLENAINVYKKLKNEGIELMVVGGQKDQAGYDLVVESGAIFVEYLHRNELFKYMAASDVFLCLSDIKQTILFSGLGTSVMEACNLGVPIVSTTLVSFQGSKNERNQIGIIPRMPIDISNVAECVRYVFNNPEKFSSNKIIAEKYFSWDFVMKIHLEEYEKLQKEYYGN